MAVIVCPQCGFENPEGSTVCEICAEPLSQPVSAPAPAPQAQPAPAPAVPAAPPAPAVPAAPAADGAWEYFVFCEESKTRTVVPSGDVQSFYCAGCKREHTVDGFLWTIEREKAEAPAADVPAADAPQTAAPKSDALWLEEAHSHFRIDIARPGGTLGRYGDFGAAFFQSRGLLTVSGEHCRISYEYGSWVLRHISRTNQTLYNGLLLGANEPNLLEDGKILTLANSVSFVVHIG